MLRINQSNYKVQKDHSSKILRQLMNIYKNQIIVLHANQQLNLDVYPIQTNYPKPTKRTRQSYQHLHDNKKNNHGAYLFTNYLQQHKIHQQNTNKQHTTYRTVIQNNYKSHNIQKQEQQYQPKQNHQVNDNKAKTINLYSSDKENNKYKNQMRFKKSDQKYRNIEKHNDVKKKNLSPIQRNKKKNLNYNNESDINKNQYQCLRQSLQLVKIPQNNFSFQVKQALNFKLEQIKQQLLHRVFKQKTNNININNIVKDLQNAAKIIINRYISEPIDNHNTTVLNNFPQKLKQDNKNSFKIPPNAKFSFEDNKLQVFSEKQAQNNYKSQQIEVPLIKTVVNPLENSLSINDKCIIGSQLEQKQLLIPKSSIIRQNICPQMKQSQLNEDIYTVTKDLQNEEYYVRYNIKFVDKRKTEVIRLSPLRFKKKQQIADHLLETNLIKKQSSSIVFGDNI